MGRDLKHLPFQVGQEAESKSFAIGYRSAWFRCKIKDISVQKGSTGYSLEFFDFPDEKVAWTKLYQKAPKPPKSPKSHGRSKAELMVRPSFPPYFRKSERPDSNPESDVVALVDDDWQVGDLVDWWSDGCFWSARVAQLLGNDKVMVDLPEPPIGEGKSYAAFCKDLRPSLNWSPEHGWTVPISREHGSSQHCAHLVQPLTHGEKTEDTTGPEEDAFMEDTPCPYVPEEDAFMEDATERTDIPIHLKLDGSTEEKYSCDASNSDDERRDSPVKSSKKSSRACRYGSSSSQEKVRSLQSKYAASMKHADTVESAIMELEELANKIRWLKGLLQFGFRWSNAMTPSWKILEN